MKDAPNAYPDRQSERLLGLNCKKPKSWYGSVIHEDFDDGWPGYEEPTITFH